MRFNCTLGRIAVVLSIPLFLVGCFEKPTEPTPSNEKIASAIVQLYLQDGTAASVEKQRVIGKHYQPHQDSWKVLACVDLTLPDSNSVTDCNDSFELIYLDSNKWILNGSVNNVYRWIEMED